MILMMDDVLVICSAALFMISCGLLGWTMVEPVVGMILYSFSLAFGPISMITSIGMILPSDYIGTGLGLFKGSNNSKYYSILFINIIDSSSCPIVGSSILDIVVGLVQDNTYEGTYVGQYCCLFVYVYCSCFKY